MSTPTVRALREDEIRAFRLARLVAAETAPYFMHALFAVTPLAAEGLGTFAVDRHWRLYMEPALLTGPHAWTPHTAAAVLHHEIGHLLRDHAGRADALPQPHYPTAWNFAADAEINDDLLDAAVPLPEGVITPAALGCEPHGLAEDYYAHLVTDPPPADDDPGCGSGAGCPPVPGELDAPHPDGTPGIDPAEAEFVRRRVAHDVTAHSTGSGRGSTPAGLTRWAAGVLAPPVVAWDRLLRAAVRRAIADKAGRSDYTYARPPRRRVVGIVKPAMRAPAVNVSVVVDTSGSMTRADLDAAMSELHGVLASTGIAREHVRLLACDATTTRPQRIRRAADVQLVGGGGTDMRVGIAAAEQTRPAPHVIIVLTDGDTPWPDAPPRARLVCALVADCEPHGTPEWAITVRIPPHRS